MIIDLIDIVVLTVLLRAIVTEAFVNAFTAVHMTATTNTSRRSAITATNRQY